MERVLGQPISIHLLAGLKKSADLIYYEGPILALFEGHRGSQYLYLWCDSDDSINRWLVLRATEEDLARYMSGGLDLRELVLSPADGFVFVADMRDDMSLAAVFLVHPSDLPISYIPTAGSKYEFEPRHTEVDLRAMADEFRSPLLNLHLVKGRGVGLGWSEITTLGPLLQETGELAQAVAIDRFAHKDKLTVHEARVYGMFRFVTHRAASFSAILRPVIQQQELPGFHSRVSEVVEAVMSMIGRTREYVGLKDVSANYPDGVIRTLERFLESVRTTGTELELRWAQPDRPDVSVVSIDPSTSTRILENINRLDTEESEGLWKIGTFTALDTKKRTYRFEAEGGRESYGRFDPKLGFPVTRISFELRYRVYATRKIQKLGGLEKPKVSEVIGEIEPVEGQGKTL